MLTTIASFSLIARDLDRSLETTAQQPAVARETEYYLCLLYTSDAADDRPRV